MRAVILLSGFFLILVLPVHSLDREGTGIAQKTSIMEERTKAPPKGTAAAGPARKGKKTEIPKSFKFSLYSGEVNFPHAEHYQDFGIECDNCHHEIDAHTLDFPHKQLIPDYRVDCGICHHEGTYPMEAQLCENCHHSPVDYADETISAKVALHKNCWKCHESGKGKEASRNCKFCHVGNQKTRREEGAK